MKIFWAFIILAGSAILWLLPVSEGIYNFRTDVKEETRTVITGAGDTTASLVLSKPVYQDDASTIEVLSSIDTDTTVIDSYTPATRTLALSGLDSDASRELSISYDVNALQWHTAFDTMLTYVPFIWIVILIAFPICGMIVMFRR